MKRFQDWRIAMFALFATFVAAFVITGVAAPDALQVCVDWVQGFTGHTDGMMLAAGLAGLGVPVGAATDDDDDDGLVPAVDPEPTRDEPQLDPATVNQLVRDAVAEVMKASRQAAPAQAQPSAPAAVAGGQTRVIGDVTPNHYRRTVALFNLMAARKDGDEADIKRFGARLAELNGQVTPAMQKAERAAAEDILTQAGFKGLALQRTMSTLTDGAGGYNVPTPVAAEIYVVAELHGLARAWSRQVPVVNKSLDLTSIATKPTVYWTAENALFTASDPVLGTGALTPSKLTALTSWTRELDEDEQVALLPVRIALIGEGFAEQEDTAFFQGDGSTYGTTTGLLNLTGAGGVTQSATQTTQASVSLAYLRQLRDAVSLRRRRGAAYFMHPDIYSLIEAEAFGTTATNLEGITKGADGEITRIWGQPFVLSEDMPATAAASEPYVVYGNPRDYVLRGEKGGVQIATSTEGIISDGSQNVVFNALQQDGVILAARERIAFATPGGYQAGFAILTTAAS